jgi:hypothetical protein
MLGCKNRQKKGGLRTLRKYRKTSIIVFCFEAFKTVFWLPVEVFHGGSCFVTHLYCMFLWQLFSQ